MSFAGYPFDYLICTVADMTIFNKQCAAIEKHIPELEKKPILTDVDGSKIQTYLKDGKKVIVTNSIDMDEVYVKSEFDIEPFF